MRLNKTRKANRIRRKTAYGGVKELNPSAESYVPEKMRSTANNTRNNSKKNTIQVSASEMDKMRELLENAVAIDCEMVGVGRESVLAHVAIVDFNGHPIYDKYVIPKYGVESITNYRTKFSGITPAKLAHLDKSKHSYNIVKNEVHNILNGKVIVGHGLVNDCKVLEYGPNPDMVWNTTLIEQFQQNHPGIPGLKQPRKLKAIAKEFANNNIQLNTKSGHSPLEDARASMNLYRISFGYPKIKYANMSR